jgi:hypothetical protein
VFPVRSLVKVKVMLRPKVSRPFCIEIKSPCEAEDQIFIMLIRGALFEERTNLLFARVTVSSNKSVVSM